MNFVKLNGHYQNRKIKEIGGNRVLYNDSQMVRLYQKEKITLKKKQKLSTKQKLINET